MNEDNIQTLDNLFTAFQNNRIHSSVLISKLLEFEKQTTDVFERFKICLALGSTYCLDGQNLNLTLAEEYLLKSENDFSFEIKKGNEGKIYFNLGHLYARKNQIENSQMYFEKYILCSDDNYILNIIKRPLYSFRKINKFTISDLVNNEITLSTPKTFNDPYDTLLYPFLNYRKRVIFEKSNYIIDPYIKAYEPIRIRCFARDTNILPAFKNRLMWSHYADGHKGICVIYKFDLSPYRVLQTYPKIKTITKWIEEKYENEIVFSDKEKESKQLLLATKHLEWKYENEIRLFHYDPTITKELQHIQIPLEKLEGKIKAIIFGSRCSVKDEQTIRELFKGQDFFFKILKIEQIEDSDNIYQMKINDEEKWNSFNPWLE